MLAQHVGGVEPDHQPGGGRTDAQSTTSQRRELEAWAERAGHTVVKVYKDQGISGAKGRDKRPAFDALLKQECGASLT